MRKETIGDAMLILGDCLEVMADHLPACLRVDAVVTDPPFGIGFEYESHDDSPEGYAEWLWARLEASERFCNPGSPIFVWQASKNAKRFQEWFPRDWRLFIAAKNFAQVYPGPMWYSFDPVVAWWTEGEYFADGLRRDFAVADSNPASRAKRGEVIEGHPCPRPLEHLTYVVRTWVRPQGTVIDPFMGSGTTGVACSQTGRRFIGIEKEPKYFDIACERIENAQRQERLFA